MKARPTRPGMLVSRSWPTAITAAVIVALIILAPRPQGKTPGGGREPPAEASQPRLRFMRTVYGGSTLELATPAESQRPDAHHAFRLTRVLPGVAMAAFELRIELSAPDLLQPPPTVTITAAVSPGQLQRITLPLEPARDHPRRWYSPPLIIAAPGVADLLAKQSGRPLYTPWGATLLPFPRASRHRKIAAWVRAEAMVSGRPVVTRVRLMDPGIVVMESASSEETETATDPHRGSTITLRLRYPFQGRERLVVDDGLESSHDAVDLTGSAHSTVADCRFLTMKALDPGPLRLCIALPRSAAGRHGIITTVGNELGCTGVEKAMDIP